MRKKDGREKQILQELVASGRISVENLSEKFQVNTSTIRRDLEQMEQRGLLRRVHGGAIALNDVSYNFYSQNITFQENATKCADAKAQIAIAAARHIKPGDTIALSPGTTVNQLARTIHYLQINNITVVTNAINVVNELAGLEDVSLNVTGGLLLPSFFALVGPQAEQSLNEIFVAKAFVGITGVSVEHGLTGPNQLEVLTHRITMQHAKHTFLLADHTKLENVDLHRVGPLSLVKTLITDQGVDPEIVRKFTNVGIEVEIAPAAVSLGTLRVS